MNYDFTGKSIKCDTWEQMLHLAKLAEEQKAKPNVRWYFNEMEFNNGNVWFVLDTEDMTYVCQSVPTGIYDIEVSYTDFITPPLPTETIEVTGCKDCPMISYSHDYDYFSCRHPSPKTQVSHYSGVKGRDKLFTTCQLKTKSITLKIKKNEPTGN